MEVARDRRVSKLQREDITQCKLVCILPKFAHPGELASLTPSRDSSYDWTGKKVAVIGNGSSAIQIVPKIQATATKLVNYVRTATWISANFSAEHARDGKNFEYSEEEKQRFRDHPEELFKLRKGIEHG